MQSLAKSEEKQSFLSCDNPEDLCSQTNSEQSALLYSCGAGVGGVFVDMVKGLVLLPQTVYEVAQNLKSVPEDYKSCSSDFQAKLMLLGSFKPKDMTNESIERMSCGEVKKFVESKVLIILTRLEERRIQMATKKGSEKVSIYDLELNEQEIQALNYDLNKSGPLKRALCMKPDEAAKMACRVMTNGTLTVTGVAANAKLVRVLIDPKNPASLQLSTDGLKIPETSVELPRVMRTSENSKFVTETKVTPEGAKHYVVTTERELKSMGVQYERAPKMYKDEHGEIHYMTTHAFSTPSREALPSGGGELFRVRSVKNANLTSPTAPALQHAEMPAFLKKLESEGYRLNVDSTLTFPGENTMGAPFHEGKVILIDPKISWLELQHEYQHVHFANDISKNFEKLKVQVKSGKDLNNVLSENAKKNFSQSQIKEMEKLMKADVEKLPVNERMATMKELELLGWRRVTTAGMEAEKYGLGFTSRTLQSLAGNQKLTSEQQQLLNEVNSRIATLDKRAPIVRTIERNPTAIGAAAAGTATAVFGSALYFNKDGEVVYRDPKTGNWVHVQGK